MSKCIIYAIANQKGGVGKTTTACNLGYALSELGHKVLLVDFDPQSNLSMSLGVENPDSMELAISIQDDEQTSTESFIHKASFADLIPSSIKLANVEMRLRDEPGGQLTLRNMLDPLREKYQYILIDTNPYLGWLTINALAACDEVIIPLSPQLWSATGLTDLVVLIGKIKRSLNRSIAIKGILFTMVDVRQRLYRGALELVQETYADINIFDARIPTTVRLGEANYNSMSILEYEPNSPASVAYREFAKEVV